MATTLRPEELVDNNVVDVNGSKVGKVGTVYLADDSRQPAWVTVRTGLFGQKESFVPLQDARMDSDGIHVRVSKDQVSDAPRTKVDEELSSEESAELYRYYELPPPQAKTQQEEGTERRPSEQDRPRTDLDDESMVRSEEQLRVGTDQVETGHARLRKYVVTEQQQVNVPVSHEEVRVEREPISEADRREGARIGEEEHDVTLHAEEPRVEKESVPVEKVRLHKERVPEEETVSGEVRKERFDIEDDQDGGQSRGSNR